MDNRAISAETGHIVNKVKKTWMVKAVEGKQNAVMGVTAHLDPELIGDVLVWEKRDRLYFGD